MALFRRKKEQDGEPQGDAIDRLAKMSIEELLEAPEVKASQRQARERQENGRIMVTRHLERIHQPGGLRAVKEAADFMDLGAGRRYLDALSDVSITIHEQVPTGSAVTSLWTVTGTQSGELCGVPPSGAPVTLEGITMSVIREGLIASEFTYWDFPAVSERLQSPARP
jgi:predicted ester cyclase